MLIQRDIQKFRFRVQYSVKSFSVQRFRVQSRSLCIVFCSEVHGLGVYGLGFRSFEHLAVAH